MKKLQEILREALPEIIAGLVVAAILAIVGALRASIGIVRAVVLIVVGAVCGGCVYLAFKRTPPLIEGGRGTWKYPRWRRLVLAGLVLIFALTLGRVAYYLYQRAQPPRKVIILIADFDGPEPQNYRVTETVLTRLRAATEPYDDVEVQSLGLTITEQEGSTVARTEGERHKATIVIWGWYGLTGGTVPLSVHFELLRSPEYMPELGSEAKGQVRTMAMAELTSFTLQPRLSAEMAYLSLFTAGMTRYTVEDWDGTIAYFSDALSQVEEGVSALSQGTVYYFRGNAYWLKSDLDHAIADYDQAIALKPDCAVAYNNRGFAYYRKGDLARAIADYDQAIALDPDHAGAYNNRGFAYADKGDLAQAIADFDQAIALKPDDAGAYYNRGLAYHYKGDLDHAIADLRKVLDLSSDPHLRQQAEEQLQVLEVR